MNTIYLIDPPINPTSPTLFEKYRSINLLSNV